MFIFPKLLNEDLKFWKWYTLHFLEGFIIWKNADDAAMIYAINMAQYSS